MAFAPTATASRARVARAASAVFPLALLVCVSAARAEDVPPPPPRTWDDLPVAEKFLSPVGSPEDFALPAPGEAQGYALTRGLQNQRRDRHLGLDLSNQRFGGEVRAPADRAPSPSSRVSACAPARWWARSAAAAAPPDRTCISSSAISDTPTPGRHCGSRPPHSTRCACWGSS